MAVICLLCAATPPMTPLNAGPQGSPAPASSGTSGLAEAELQRRQALVRDASEAIQQATEAAAAGDWQTARELYRNAWRSLPNAPATAAWRDYALEEFANSSVQVARQQAVAGELNAARRTLDEVLADGVHPKHGPASTLRAQLDDPERFNPAVTPEHLARVDEVNRLLLMARGYQELADWDRAEDTLMQVLRIDPTSVTARRQMESIQRQIRGYTDSARDHTRENMLADVDRMWETDVPLSIDISGMFGAGGRVADPGQPDLDILGKMRRIVIPQVDLVNVTVREALDFLSAQVTALDAAEPDPDRRGISFVVSPAVPDERVINLNLRQTPVEEVLRYITTQSGTSFRVEAFVVRINSASDAGEGLTTRSYQVPPNFIQMQPMEDQADAFDPFGPVGGQPERGLSLRRMGAREFLEQQGVTFPEGATATFNPVNSTLVVRNTRTNLEMVEFLVDEALGTAPRQVEIRMTMIQVRRQTLDELGLDWLLGPFDMGGGNFGAGGTVAAADAENFFAGFPLGVPGDIPIGRNPVTAGLRGAEGLLSAQSIDNLLSVNPGGDPRLQGGGGRVGTFGRSPSVLSVAGALTSPQYQVILRAISQNRDVDIAVAPAVVTRSGQRTQVEIIREFPYPVEFEPPQIPQQIGPNFNNDFFNNDFDVGAGNVGAPFVPGGPSSFEVRRVGVILDAEPIISEDNTIIELSIAPEIVLFEGFIDYGSPVTIGGGPNQRAVAAQPYVQPVFRTNRLNTSISIYDGATVVLGGVVLQNLRGIHDRVPIFGDVPLAGRLFQSKADSDNTLNVVFFVNVRVIDPGGRPVNR